MKQRMRMQVVLAAAMLVLPAGGGAHAQGISDVAVDLTGRIQYQFHTSNVPGADETFEFRRLRLGAGIRVGESILGFIEPDFSQADLEIKSAWIDYIVDPAFAVRAGQFKKPFGRVQLTSSTTYPAIERGLRIRDIDDAFDQADVGTGSPVLTRLDGPLLGEEQYLLDALGYQSYDMGLAVHGDLGVLGYEAGVFNGTGADALDEDGSKAVAARLTLTPSERLELGAGVSRTDLAITGDDGVGVAWEIDAEWGGFREPGVHLIGEMAFGDNIATADDDLLAAQLAAAWFAPLALGRIEGLEPVVRGSWGDPRRDVEDDAGLLLTPGINLYFQGRNRLMVNYDVFVPEGDRFETVRSLKVQAQLHF